MRAAWYDHQGPSSVLQVGELATPQPGAREVRVRLTRSGINPGDTKKRSAAFGGMAYVVALDDDQAAAILRVAPGGVDRIVEVAFDANGAKAQAGADLTAAAAAGALTAHVGAVFPLERIAEAQDAVDSGSAQGRVLLSID